MPQGVAAAQNSVWVDCSMWERVEKIKGNSFYRPSSYSLWSIKTKKYLHSHLKRWFGKCATPNELGQMTACGICVQINDRDRGTLFANRKRDTGLAVRMWKISVRCMDYRPLLQRLTRKCSYQSEKRTSMTCQPEYSVWWGHCSVTTLH